MIKEKFDKMTKREVLNEVVENHNRLATISVNGDNAIKMAETLISLRKVAGELQRDIEQEQG